MVQMMVVELQVFQWRKKANVHVLGLLSLSFFLMEWKVKSLAENIVRVEFARGGV